MNFLDAVTALNAGQCEGIRREETFLPNNFLRFDGDELMFNTGEDYYNLAHNLFADDWQLVNPKPLTEEVEVVVWQYNYANGMEPDYCTVEPVPVKNDTVVKLTGTFTREVKPKVKRREELTPRSMTMNEVILLRPDNQTAFMTTDMKFYREWEE